MRVSVDQNLCYGSADCVFRVGSVFTTVDGFGAVVPGREDSGDDPRVREAAEQCPSQAISITEGREGTR
ncbi:ferredoxin [Streptomyces griseoviridis]|jgi:ferredoxin|uniref:Ferredoxin n=2 Tax=Streptomyces TaxID=1883 RepID=A0A918GH55_STRGD|nr:MULTISPECIES: ferredoxin [Streptomyces]GGS37466.1 ferredoxin [Streptomyces niveoruber]GGU26610.1 ferredoxin [Streptomyces daghestanicus]GHI32588.1 ferredoxin [Streptomyces daghestanicus]